MVFLPVNWAFLHLGEIPRYPSRKSNQGLYLAHTMYISVECLVCNDAVQLERRLLGPNDEISPEAISRQIEPSIQRCQHHRRKRAGKTWQNTVPSWREILYRAPQLEWPYTFQNRATHKKEHMVCGRSERKSESKAKASKGVQLFWKRREFL